LAEGGHARFREADPEAADALAKASVLSRDRVFSLNGESLTIEGGAWGGAIARIKLLHVLQELFQKRGIRVRYGVRIDNPDRFDADLV
ncbi:hypothetical protein ACSTLM_00950, partial [Vibrio parahaemolyticus]